MKPESIHPISLFRATLKPAIVALAAAGSLSAAPLKVDINNNNRSLSEGLDPAFTAWSTVVSWFPGGTTMSATFSGVTVKFTRAGSVGGDLEPGYWKEGVQSTDYNIKLTADGVRVKDGDAGAQIEMRISGLSAGPHTLLLWLNSWSGVTSNAPLDILVNGTQVVNDLAVSQRVTNNNNATTAYLDINAVAGQDVVVLVKAETGGSQTMKNVHINAFEIDTPNTRAQANNPVPANADEHVNADNGSLTLQWGTAVSGAASHNVYFGMNESAVTSATTASPEYKGNQSGNSYPLGGLNPQQRYFWRVDEVAANGTVTKGTVWIFRPRRLAFPGAEGYGRYAQGGRGGVVRKVTNLNNSGAGSLRDAIEGNYGARTVVFDVSGTITLESDLIIDESRPYITVAGQTAPGKGIMVKKHVLGFSGARDTIFRYMRMFVGKESGETQNATGITGGDNSIMDHVSAGWGLDEGLSARGAKNVTFQRSMIAEMLNVAGHDKYPEGTAHGYAATISGKIGSFHHNLLAHNEGRNWSVGDEFNGSGGTTYSSQMDITNNVVYNWGGRTTDGTGHEINFVNNYYKIGPSSSKFVALTAQLSSFDGTQGFYFSGNVMPGKFTEANQTAGRTSTGTVSYNIWSATPFFPSYVTTDTATNAYKKVLSDVGCNLPQIDNHNKRIINETLNGTTTYTGSVSGKKGLIDTTNDAGGWENYGTETRPPGFDTDNDGMPDWWEAIKGTNPNSGANNFIDSNADPDGDGYTALEEYLNWLAAPNAVCKAGGNVEIDLAALSVGYSKTTPVYTVASPANGTVAIVSGNKARFAAAGDVNGLGRFTYTVKDGANDSMTRTINVRVLGLPTVTIVATDAVAGEYGPDKTLQFTITRTGDTTAALTVPLVVSGVATAGTDYSGFSNSVTIPAGQGAVVLPLTVFADDFAEGAETIITSLGASADFTVGTPASAEATIQDRPSQDNDFRLVQDPAKRGPLVDADGDSLANLVEYFMGSDPGNAGSHGAVEIAPSAAGVFKVRYPRARNRPDASGSLRWSADLANWIASGQSDGTRTVIFTETIVSAAGADPEIVEATGMITGGEAAKVFVRLEVR